MSSAVAFGLALLILVSALGLGGARVKAYGSPSNAATPWWIADYIGFPPDSSKCAIAGLNPLTGGGSDAYYASPESLARDIATALRGKIYSITYTDQYVNGNQVIPAYVISLTGSKCLMSYWDSSLPDEPLWAALAEYWPATGFSQPVPYGTVCKDDSYVPRGQTCDDSKCQPDYCVPDDWDTKLVQTLTPGVEPLNVIISAKSDVPLTQIYAAMHDLKTGEWASGCAGAFRVSAEQANISHESYADQDEAWRKGGCAGGNHLSLFGLENHVRIWHQDVPGSKPGAWFISASFETLCVRTKDGLEPFRRKNGTFRHNLRLWHCIDGGPGSYFSNGYNDGASNFTAQLKQAAAKADWHVTIRTDSRPAGIGENGVAYDGTVNVITITR